MKETKFCPHCNQPIEDEDNLILCVSCQKPYHKECWTKCKCFINCGMEDYEPTISNYDDNENLHLYNSPEITDYDILTDLMSLMFGKRRFRSRILGKSIANSIQDTISDKPIDKEQFNNLSEQEKYVGKNYQYYGYAFRKLKEYNSNTFNFSAFFFTIPWLLYRKMYKESVIALAFMISISLTIIQITHIIETTTSLIGTFGKWIDISVTVILITNLIFAIILGNIANKLYLKKIEKQIANKKAYSSGGTNIIIAIVVTYILLHIFIF